MLLFLSLQCISQETLSYKDGKKFALKPELDACIKAAEKTSPSANAPVYCNCLLRLLAKHYTSTEVDKLIKGNHVEGATSLVDRFTDVAKKEFYTCMKSASSNTIKVWTKDEETVFYRTCLNSLPKDSTWNSKIDANKFCKCNLDKMKNRFSDKELMDENNNQVKVISKQCLTEAMKYQR